MGSGKPVCVIRVYTQRSLRSWDMLESARSYKSSELLSTPHRHRRVELHAGPKLDELLLEESPQLLHTVYDVYEVYDGEYNSSCSRALG